MILNLGSGRTSYGLRVVNLDIGPFSNVDVVAMGERLPVADASLDAVITQGVLEHVPDLPATLAEIDRVLRPGGLVYHEIPFIQGFHGSPTDYRRFTLTGIGELAPGYEVLDAGVACGPSSAMLWISSEWLAMLFSFGNDVLFKAGRRGFAWLLSPIKLADAWLEHYPRADLIAGRGRHSDPQCHGAGAAGQLSHERAGLWCQRERSRWIEWQRNIRLGR